MIEVRLTLQSETEMNMRAKQQRMIAEPLVRCVASKMRKKEKTRDWLLQKSVDCTSAADMEHVASVSVNEVFVFMGRELEALDEIPAGNILGTVCVSL